MDELEQEQLRGYTSWLLSKYEELVPEQYFRDAFVTEIDDFFKKIDGEE